MSCKGEKGFVFKNWSQTFSCEPGLYFKPKYVDDLKRILKDAKENNHKIKIIGGGLSPSDIACTDDYMISMENFNRVLKVDKENLKITVEAGVRISQLNEEILPSLNMALTNQASVSEQTVAGMIATGCHGTGAGLGAFSSCVLEITLMTANGSEIHCSKIEEKQLFEAAQCHLGVLGIILDVTLQCEPAFNLHEKRCSATLSAVLTSLDKQLISSEHFRFLWFPHTDYAVTHSLNRTNLKPKQEGSWIRNTLIGYYILEFCLWLATFFRCLIPFINRVFFEIVYYHKKERVDISHKVFNIDCLFKQHVTEWAIPQQHTATVLTQMKEWLDQNSDVKAHFPVEVRFVKKDDAMMTPSGDDDVTYIGIISYRPYGKEVEREKWWNFFETLAMKYRGKPHWAKAHKVGSSYLRRMYRRYDEFMRIREKVDPDQIFFNRYWMRIMDEDHFGE